MAIKYTITPEDYVRAANWTFKRRGDWIEIETCPFCEGGSRGDKNTFAVHKQEGNFKCHRVKCNEAGTFWRLLELAGLNPRECIDRTYSTNSHINGRSKNKPYIYGR